MKYLGIFIFITSIFSVLFNNVDGTDYLLLIVSGLITMGAVIKTPFANNMCRYVVLLVVWISVVLMPVYHLVAKKSLFITQLQYDRVLEFGIYVFFITSLMFVLTGRSRGTRSENNINYKPINIKERYVIIFLIFLYFLSAFCFKIGLGRMGMEAVVLPFHLGGIINLFRNTLVPLLFAIIVENYILRGEKFPKKIFALYLGWTLIEVMAWLSKGMIVGYMLPVGAVLYFYYRPPIKKIVKYVWPILLFFILMYPIIGTMRSMERKGIGGSMSENFKEATSSSSEREDDGSGNAVLRPLNRAFMTAGQYIYDYDEIKGLGFFDFAKAPVVILSGGAAAYQTFIMENYPTWAAHSSGTTGIMDALLHGGRGLVYVTIVVLMFFSKLFDGTYNKEKYSIYFILVSIVLNLIQNSNITNLYTSLGIQTLAVQILCIILANKMNYKVLSSNKV